MLNKMKPVLFGWFFWLLVAGVQATSSGVVFADPISVTLAIIANGHVITDPKAVSKFSSLDLVSLKIEVKAPEGYYNQQTFRLQTATNNSPASQPDKDNVWLKVSTQSGRALSRQEIAVSYWGEGGGTGDNTMLRKLMLFLKVPTDRSPRLAYWRKVAASEKSVTSQTQVEQLANLLADEYVDSKPGFYTVSAAFKNPKNGEILLSNSMSFEIVYKPSPVFDNIGHP